MTLAVVITPAAEVDLQAAIEWYESKQPELSCHFRLALDAALSVVARHPDSSLSVTSSLRRALLRRFPHAVYYRHTETVIEVVAILHTSRHPRVWQARER